MLEFPGSVNSVGMSFVKKIGKICWLCNPLFVSIIVIPGSFTEAMVGSRYCCIFYINRLQKIFGWNMNLGFNLA